MADKDDYWFYQSRTAPPPFAQPRGENWRLLWGHFKDVVAEGAKEAIYASLPLRAAPDALGAAAAEQSTERYPSESDSAYRARVASPFDQWALGGTSTGVLDAVISTEGVSSVAYQEASVYDPGVDGGAGWNWARFKLTFTTTWRKSAVWGAGWKYGDGYVWGVSAPAGALGFVFRQVQRWKAAHAKLDQINAWTVDGTIVIGV